MERARVSLSQIRKDIGAKHPDAAGIDRMIAYADSHLALTPTNPETPIEVVRFSPEARKALEGKGFTIHELTGQSIATLREAGRPFWSSWHKDYPDFEALPSRHSEVAINPGKLFLPDSQRKTLAQQQRMVAEFSEKLGIEGIEAVIGSAPDYIDLTFAHLDATGMRLFGEDYDYDYTRTTTPTVGSFLALVGNFDADIGLLVSDYDPGDRGNGGVRVSPLVVPTGK